MNNKQRSIQKVILNRLMDLDNCNVTNSVSSEILFINWSIENEDTGEISVYSSGYVKGYFPAEYFNT